jgi:hypothetical protein
VVSSEQPDHVIVVVLHGKVYSADARALFLCCVFHCGVGVCSGAQEASLIRSAMEGGVIIIDEPSPSHRYSERYDQRRDEGPFYFPGITEITSRSDNAVFISGKAVATALATGLAATILRRCYLLESAQAEEWSKSHLGAASQQGYYLRQLNGSKFMAAAFRAISHG